MLPLVCVPSANTALLELFPAQLHQRQRIHVRQVADGRSPCAGDDEISHAVAYTCPTAIGQPQRYGTQAAGSTFAPGTRRRRPRAGRMEVRRERVPAWLAENPSVGGAVFSSRTAGNDAYQPPADPPRQALSSCPARSSVFFFSPWLSRSKFRLHISRYGSTETKARQSTSKIDTAVATLVGYSRRDPPALVPQCQNRPQHATVMARFLL